MKNVLIIFSCLFIFNASCAQAKFKPTKEMTQIIPLKNECTVKVGETLYYSASVHGSVGSSTSVSVNDESIVQLQETKFEYDDEEEAKMPGGDAATKYFIYKALKVGETEMIVINDFRGETESTFRITIKVIE